MGIKNRKSLLIHFGIMVLASLVIILPELEAYISTFVDPQLVALVVLFVWTLLKKVLDTTE